jgi:MFS family permease
LAGFRALRSPRFCAYLSGQLVSLVGTWLQQVTVALLAFRITGTSAAVGAALACSQLPILILSPLAGILNDRFDRRRVLICTQLASLLQALLFLASYTAGSLNIAMIFTLSVLGGLINSLDTPARQSIVARLVDRAGDIRNAIALNAASVHVARLVGPALAALFMAKWDVRICFGANAASCAVFALVLGGLKGVAHDPIRRISWNSLREGWQYCMGNAHAREALAWIFVASVFAVPYTSLLPAAARIWSASTPISYANLMAAAGAGAIFAALALAQIETDATLRKSIPGSILAAALGLLALGTVGSRLPVPAIFAAVVILGFSLTITISGGNVLLQQSVPEALRGRVMGLFVMLFNGVAPLGALIWGFVADQTTISIALSSAGAAIMTFLIFGRLLFAKFVLTG